jgi:hypothetical protein
VSFVAPLHLEIAHTQRVLLTMTPARYNLFGHVSGDGGANSLVGNPKRKVC